ncbi:sodium:solute symporter family protein [Bizionia gelidisalsuginis]|uniref:Sodium:solute symporter family protein n=1 Tax=Bizionia gelidisalsuginis TaxID=291188 RepID=A0ABY3MDQ8_9FLAO|nr:sodium:solute symporter family protein [Bizionia gelidisalsuginis]TYC17152.1 sodium:solute symporter family protein [Bizionia gelidisalsuginis]
MPNNTLTILFLSLYVLGIITIGIRNRKSKNSEDYFLGSRKLPAWLLAITFIASWWGGGSAIDLVDHAHQNGLSSFWIYGVPVLIATALMFLFAKGIRNIGSLSQPQLMRERYNDNVALLLTVFIIIFMVIASAIQVIVIGKFFNAFFNISYEMGALIGTVIVLTYSLFGGFRGVVITDFLQFIFFLFTGIFLFYLTYTQSGGMEAVKSTAIANGNTGYTSFFNKVSDNLAYVITFGTSWMIQANIWQRISAAKKASDAKKMMVISFLAFIPLYLMVTYTGMFSSVIYDTVPQVGIVPDLISKIENPLLSALLFLGLCSAMMSTMDSLINTGALSLTVDIHKKYINPEATENQSVKIARWSTLIMCTIALFIALKIKSVLTISWIGSDFLTSGAFVPLIFGFLWARGTAKAATISMVFGLLFSTYNLLVALGVDLPVDWDIASAKQAIIGLSASLIVYVVCSLFTSPDFERSRRFIQKANILNRKTVVLKKYN